MKLKKRHITLIEIMIVMFLIALITGVVAYNYSGSLDEGKASKTKIGQDKLESILSLALADNPSLDIETQWRDIIKKSPLVQNADALTKDGWGEVYQVERDQEGRIIVTSQKYKDYQQHHSTLFKDDRK